MMLKYIGFILASLLWIQSANAAITSGGRTYDGVKKIIIKRNIRCPNYCTTISKYSREYNVPAQLIVSIIHNESAFNPKAVSPKGAKGLMQLMDINSKAAQINPFDPHENIRAGTALFSRLMKRYNNVELALAAYNAGEGNVAKYGGVPPFPETRQYIKKVMAHYKTPPN
ncbi:lytic transglycosylase domain-containing protein [Vibrio scophthalmi]|nr:lytic transglycosylase domain-containing protein [Vibrio scophthalmi]